MRTSNRINSAERFGHWLGRGWRACARGERQIVGGLLARGMPAGAAAAMLWGVKLVVVGALLYTAFWLTLLLVFMVATAWLARNGGLDEDEQKPEWRVGLSGYGLYRGDIRIDPGEPDDD